MPECVPLSCIFVWQVLGSEVQCGALQLGRPYDQPVPGAGVTARGTHSAVVLW